MSLQNPIAEKFHHRYFKYLNYNFHEIVEETNNSNLPDSLKEKLIEHYETVAHNQTYRAYNDEYDDKKRYKYALAAINNIRREFGLPYPVRSKTMNLPIIEEREEQEQPKSNQLVAKNSWLDKLLSWLRR